MKPKLNSNILPQELLEECESLLSITAPAINDKQKLSAILKSEKIPLAIKLLTKNMRTLEKLPKCEEILNLRQKSTKLLENVSSIEEFETITKIPVLLTYFKGEILPSFADLLDNILTKSMYLRTVLWFTLFATLNISLSICLNMTKVLNFIAQYLNLPNHQAQFVTNITYSAPAIVFALALLLREILLKIFDSNSKALDHIIYEYSAQLNKTLKGDLPDAEKLQKIDLESYTDLLSTTKITGTDTKLFQLYIIQSNYNMILSQFQNTIKKSEEIQE